MRLMTASEIERAGALWNQGRNSHEIAVLMQVDQKVIHGHLDQIKKAAIDQRKEPTT